MLSSGATVLDQYIEVSVMRRTISDDASQEPLSHGQNRLNQRRVGPREYARRRSLLHEDPDIDVVDMATLVAVANAIEEEAVRRYEQLADLMERRGEPATAAAFRVMLEEERRHVTAVHHWAASVGESVPLADTFEWRLPPELSSSWEEIAGSALLTPYVAFAMAVENEQRAFSFYAYLAAHAENAQIRAEAEKLGAEELRHAALLRRWRRRAYHRERRPARQVPLEIDSVEMLRDVLAQKEASISRIHHALAQRLELAGETADAQLLERMIPISLRPPASTVQSPTGSPAAKRILDAAGSTETDPRRLLVDAQKPLESLADILEAAMVDADGDLFEEAANAMHSVVERMAEISMAITRASETRGS